MGNEDDHLQSISECPDCASQNIVHSTMRDQVICKDCGLVFEPFAPIEGPAGAMPVGKAKPVKAKRAPKARKARAGPAKKVKKSGPKKKARKPARKKWGWW